MENAENTEIITGENRITESKTIYIYTHTHTKCQVVLTIYHELKRTFKINIHEIKNYSMRDHGTRQLGKLELVDHVTLNSSLTVITVTEHRNTTESTQLYKLDSRKLHYSQLPI